LEWRLVRSPEGWTAADTEALRYFAASEFPRDSIGHSVVGKSIALDWLNGRSQPRFACDADVPNRCEERALEALVSACSNLSSDRRRRCECLHRAPAAMVAPMLEQMLASRSPYACR
jgi:hypothetical protein